MASAFRALRSQIGAFVREFLLHWKIFGAPHGGPRLLVFVCDNVGASSALLRGSNITNALQARGWSTLVCPKHLRLPQRKRIIQRFKPDVILLQMARHPLNVPQPYAPIPCVLDMDDADFQSPEQVPRLLACMHGCARVIAGSAYVADWCRQQGAATDIIWTSTPVRELTHNPQSSRAQIISWAASDPLGYPHEAEFVRQVAQRVAEQRPGTILRLYADDGSPAYRALVKRFRGSGIKVETRPLMTYDRFLDSLEEVAVGLNPLVNIGGFSAGKSFGKVLGYLDAKVPCVCFPNVDHPLFFETGRNGFMPETLDEWVQVVVKLLDDPKLRQSVADAAHVDFVQRLSLDAVAESVGASLKLAIASGAPQQ